MSKILTKNVAGIYKFKPIFSTGNCRANGFGHKENFVAMEGHGVGGNQRRHSAQLPGETATILYPD